MDIDPGRVPDQNQPVAKNVERVYWSFSLRFWKQIDNFGLSESDPKWFVSLLDKLRELSSMEKGKFLADRSSKSAWRYHPIDWNQKNIPIQRSDLDWVDPTYLENVDEYPLVQFQVSKAFGRVVGFWDEKDVFNIVLLDPLHNLQPSKDFNYRVNPCSPLSCSYSGVLFEIEKIKSNSQCKSPDCGYKKSINMIDLGNAYTNVIVHFVDDDQYSKVEELKVGGLIDSASDLVSYGIDYIEEMK